MRSQRRTHSLCAMLPLFATTTASAYGGNAAIDLNQLRPAPGLHKVVTQDLAAVGRHLELTAQAMLHYADKPLVFCLGSSDCPTTLVAHRVLLDQSLSISLWQRVEFALSVPLAVYQASSPPPVGARSPATDSAAAQSGDVGALSPNWLALGDLRLRSKVLLYSQPAFGVGAVATLSLPSGDGNSFMGSALPSLTLRLLGHGHYRKLTAVLNAGWIFAASESVLNLRSGMGLEYGAALAVELFRDGGTPFSLFGEVLGTMLLRRDPNVDLPAEFVLGAKSQFGAWGFTAGFGSGIHSGAGVPNVRGFLSINWTWHRQKASTQ